MVKNLSSVLWNAITSCGARKCYICVWWDLLSSLRRTATHQLYVTAILLVAISGLLFLALRYDSKSPALPVDTKRLGFGNRDTANVGWLMPADALVMTTFTSNQTLSRFLNGGVNVFDYHMLPGTTLKLGIYLNGHLEAFRAYELGNRTDPSRTEIPAQMLTQEKPELAHFTLSMMGTTVGISPLTSDFPAGTSVTLTAWTNLPLWVQVDPESLVRSYETLADTSYSPSANIVPETNLTAPYSLAIGIESYAN